MGAASVLRSAWILAGLAGLMLFSGAVRADAALDWLNRAAAAAKQLSYSGAYVYHHGEHVEILRVFHRADANGEHEKIEVLDKVPRSFVRINNDMYCHLADGKHVRLDRNTSRRFFPAVLPANPARLLDFYEAKLVGSERVAGHACQVLVLEPRDGYRYAYTLWLDKRTGLPLKSRITNSDGGIVSMYVFSEVQIGKAPDMRLFQNDLSGKKLLKPAGDKQAEGAWNVKPPPGFELVQEAVRALPGRKAPVKHLVFSDGLNVVSMFIEPVDANEQRLHGLSAEGVIGVYAREVDGHTVTTVGEVPSQALIETGNSARKQ